LQAVDHINHVAELAKSSASYDASDSEDFASSATWARAPSGIRKAHRRHSPATPSWSSHHSAPIILPVSESAEWWGQN